MGASLLLPSTGAPFQFTGRGQWSLRGGGVRKVNTTSIGWNYRFIVIGVGHGTALCPDGYFDISMPANGTVIEGSGGASDVSVSSGMIQLPAWGALWYELPLGSVNTMQPSNFKVTGYTTDFSVPDHWVMICANNQDGVSTGNFWMWGDGQQSDYWRAPTLQNSWVPYNTENVAWNQPGYKREGNRVQLRGLIKAGSTTTDTLLFNLPQYFRPSHQYHLATVANNAFGALGVGANGNVVYKAGSNVWFSLDGANFPVEN